MENAVVLIHGAFAGPWCLENFRSYFQGRGWTCHAPALRYHDADPKSEPDPALAGTSIEDYTSDMAAFVEAMGAAPIIVGHAVGGIVAQKLAAKGLARAIVLLNPNVPWGILPSTDDERAVAKGLMQAGAFWNTAMRVQFDLIAPYAFNKLDPATQHAVFDRLGPESGTVMFEMFFWMFDDRQAIRVDFEKVRCPVLVVSGAEDRAVPPVTARKIADRYGPNATFHEAQDHAHFLFLEPGWEQVAQYCADWMSKVLERPT
jgi:pimeloyl-ACP methyl ester carboxylesterase